MTSPEFRVQHHQLGPVGVVRPVGDLEAETTATMVRATTAALGRTCDVVVDLSAVSSVDCHAAGALVGLAQEARERGGRLRVAALPPHVHRLFALLDLYDVLGGRGDVAAECRAALRVGTGHRERAGSKGLRCRGSALAVIARNQPHQVGDAPSPAQARS